MARLNHVKSFRGTTKTENGLIRCGKCGITIVIGESYMWWANRLPGAPSGHRNIRCSACPPSIAERTPGRAGEFMMAQQNAEGEIAQWCGEMQNLLTAPTPDAESLYAPRDVLDGFADEVEGISQEMIESADNMEEGFGHATSTSDELRERGEDLESQASDVRETDFEDVPDRDDFCGTEGEFEAEEYLAALEAWITDCETAAVEAINNMEMP